MIINNTMFGIKNLATCKPCRTGRKPGPKTVTVKPHKRSKPSKCK